MAKSLENPGAAARTRVRVHVLHAQAIAADAPFQEACFKAGWDRKQVKVFAYACTDGLLQPTVRDYNAAALNDGVDGAQAVSRAGVPRFGVPDVPVHLGARGPNLDHGRDRERAPADARRPFINEALNGGRCKPDGMLGDILKKHKDKL